MGSHPGLGYSTAGCSWLRGPSDTPWPLKFESRHQSAAGKASAAPFVIVLDGQASASWSGDGLLIRRVRFKWIPGLGRREPVIL